MIGNTDITVYNRYYDKENRADKWQKTVLRNVFFDETKGANRLAGGLVADDKILVMIPFNASKNRVFKQGIYFKDMVEVGNYFTLREGDKIVKGVCEEDIDDVTDDIFVISSVDTHDFGSKHMRHWEVSAKW